MSIDYIRAYSNDPTITAVTQKPIPSLDGAATAPSPVAVQSNPLPTPVSTSDAPIGTPAPMALPTSAPTVVAAPTVSTTAIAADPNFLVVNTTSALASASQGDSYSGPFAGLQHQYVNVTPDNLAVAAASPNSFIVTGSGNDAIDVSGVSGNNVLDGGSGSNFLVGGAGTDTFFIDAQNETSATWSTVANFHGGDAATLWGLTPQNFALQWLDGQGAPGHEGFTLAATGPSWPNINLTLSGYTTADLSNGRLSTVFGASPGPPGTPGNPYLYIHAN